jgi:hypothetical protein
MPDLTRFAGYESPASLTRDPLLSREEKITALRTWEGLLRRFHALGAGDPPAEKNLLDEIERALAGLDHH